MEEILMPDQAALYLKVSQTTIKNWLRAGILDKLTLSSLKEFKSKGLDGRLTLRANKQVSIKQFSPGDYGGVKPKDLEKWEKTLESFLNYPLEEILFFAAEDLIEYSLPIKNSFLDKEMAQWEVSLFRERKKNKVRGGIKFPSLITDWKDFTGWLYQSLIPEGAKSRRGAYFTPEKGVSCLIQELLPDNFKGDFFDPSCGTGTFLAMAAQKIKNPNALYGQDSDPLAVRLARINLMLLFPQYEFEPQIYQGDSLLAPHSVIRNKRFDRIGTNPPWGYRFSEREKSELKKNYPLGALESSSCFLLSALKHLTAQGKAGMLLPESLLHRERHREIREKLEAYVYKIGWLGQIFPHVQSECFALFMNGAPRESQQEVMINHRESHFLRTKKSFSANPLGVWNIFTSPEQEKIFRKIFNRPYLTLKNNGRWGMGIVTGDNRQHVKAEPGIDTHPLVSGKDLQPFGPVTPRLYLDYQDRKLQQKAPLEDYLSPKILYRFISDKPVMVMDQEGFLLLNSVNYIIPSSPVHWETVILLFNSTLYGLYFKKTFHSLKTLKSQLEILPIPLLNDRERSEISRIYKGLIRDYEGYREDWNHMVYDIFNMTTEEREILERKL